MDRLRFGEKLSYGLGDTASNFFYQTFNIFLLYYYTDVFGISAGAVGTLFFVSKLWDALNDPIMGAVADRTRSRWGRFRPYLLWMAVPYGIIGYAMFAGPDLSETGKLVWAWVTYSLMMMAYTAINVPYSALLGVISPSSQERTVVSTYRFVCAFSGGFLIALLARPLTRYFGAEDEAYGFKVTMAIFAVCSVALFWLTFAKTKERVNPPAQNWRSLPKDLKSLLTNRAWIALFFAGIFSLSNVAVRSSVTVHYFKYNVGDANVPYLFFLDKTTLFMSSGMLVMIAGVACTPLLAKRFGKKRLMIALTLLNALAMGSFYFIPPDQFGTMLAVNLIGTFLVGPTPALVWAMYADAADYGEWRDGRRCTALTFSAAQFSHKFGLTVGGGLAGWLLYYFGFQANEQQTAESLRGISLLFSIVPMTFAILNAVAVLFYNLTDSRVQAIECDLRQRRAAAGQGAA